MANQQSIDSTQKTNSTDGSSQQPTRSHQKHHKGHTYQNIPATHERAPRQDNGTPTALNRDAWTNVQVDTLAKN